MTVDDECVLQLLNEDGVLTPSPSLELDVTAELCRTLYRDMVLARRLDHEAYSLQRQGELGLWLMSWGQEAAQVGSIRAMHDNDHIFPSYREHAAALCRGIGPSELLSQWRGTTHGGWDPATYHFHIYSLVLATQTLHATGYAMGVKADGVDEVVLAYLGDGATSQGDANEAFNWAAVMHVPLVFFCQNNQWAISTPVSEQTRTPLHQRAAGFGLRSAVVDGNDVLAVFALTRKLAGETRSGAGPAFIEARTFRMGGHSTSDDPGRYREEELMQTSEQLDPITRLRKLMVTNDWVDDQSDRDLEAEADELAAETRRACIALRPGSLELVFRSTLMNESQLLRAEREQFTAFARSFA